MRGERIADSRFELSVAGAVVKFNNFVGILLACVLGWSLCSNAFSQEQPLDRQKYDALFAETLKHPSDLDLAFKFAEIASRLGDYEAAIGVLERMLFYNPGLGRVKLELGVLYFKLGANAQAKTYFQSAVAPEDTPADVKTKVQSFLSEIDKRSDVNSLSGFFQFGARYQSNVNAGPDSLNVRALGFDAVLNSNNARRWDWNGFVLGGVRHVYDFDTQTGETWETNLNYYLTWQRRSGDLDVKIGEVNTGPRINVPAALAPGASIRPYFIVGGLALGGEDYQHSHGYGTAIRLPVMTALFEFGAETRRRVFEDSWRYPTADQQTGVLNTFFGSVTIPLFGGLSAIGRANYTNNRANFGFNSYVQNGFDGGLIYEFDSLLPGSSRKWSVAGTIGAVNIRYHDPNPLIDPNIYRRDREMRAGLTLDTPLTDMFGFSAQLNYTDNRSTLPNYKYRNLAISFGPTIRF